MTVLTHSYSRDMAEVLWRRRGRRRLKTCGQLWKKTFSIFHTRAFERLTCGSGLSEAQSASSLTAAPEESAPQTVTQAENIMMTSPMFRFGLYDHSLYSLLIHKMEEKPSVIPNW